MPISDLLVDILVKPFFMRFNENYKVSPETRCWVWVGRIDKDGQPIFSTVGTPRSARVVAWWLFNGNIEHGIRLYRGETCHPNCVRPSHMQPSRVPPHLTKIDEEIVRAIRASDKDDIALAQKYHISVVTVRNVKQKKTWAHVH